ncbi:hypothetical protein ACFW9I_02640 [[Kitasatospora] papulosa]|uniref:hypothetical protein n=1 Tax=[Kitasatospora] papulosa TaxID=1464011 RepID=UPI0036BC8DA3
MTNRMTVHDLKSRLDAMMAEGLPSDTPVIILDPTGNGASLAADSLDTVLYAGDRLTRRGHVYATQEQRIHQAPPASFDAEAPENAETALFLYGGGNAEPASLAG